jgi:isoleucyl-tRNA synthetase
MDHQEQILEELNVKSIEFIARDAGLVSYRIKPHLPRLGKRFGRQVPAIRTALEEADGAAIASAVARGDSFALPVDGEIVDLGPEDVLIETHSAEGFACGEDAGFLTALDTTLDEELLREGIARELIRTVQDARKQAGLDVSDRIVLGISGSSGVQAALEKYRDHLMAETLAVEWRIGMSTPLIREYRVLDGEEWAIELKRGR